MRHTFATRKLVEWYRAGLDVTRELPKLSTYLGHVDVSHYLLVHRGGPRTSPVSRPNDDAREARNELSLPFSSVSSRTGCSDSSTRALTRSPPTGIRSVCSSASRKNSSAAHHPDSAWKILMHPS